MDRLEKKVRIFRDQVALDSTTATAKFKAMQEKHDALDRKCAALQHMLDEMKVEEQVAQQERQSAAAGSWGQAAIDVQNYCIEQAMHWTRKERRDIEVDGFAEFNVYLGRLSAFEQARGREALSAVTAAAGIGARELGDFEALRKVGNQRAHERTHMMSAGERRERLHRATAAFPLRMWSAESDSMMVTVERDVAVRLTSLYLSVHIIWRTAPPTRHRRRCWMLPQGRQSCTLTSHATALQTLCDSSLLGASLLCQVPGSKPGLGVIWRNQRVCGLAPPAAPSAHGYKYSFDVTYYI